MQKSNFFTKIRLFGILLKCNLIKIWTAGIIKKMTVITQTLSVITRNDGTIAVNAQAFIIKENLNYIFIYSTIMIIFLKNDERCVRQSFHFWLKHVLLLQNNKYPCKKCAKGFFSLARKMSYPWNGALDPCRNWRCYLLLPTLFKVSCWIYETKRDTHVFMIMR